MTNKKEKMTKIRKHLVSQMESSLSLEEFDLAEVLLVMHDTGVIQVSEGTTGEPLFSIDESISAEVFNTAERFYDGLKDSSNDVWTSYIYKDFN